MALTKDKKAEVVAQIAELLESSKLTVVANYPGTSVSAMQSLRKQASENSTIIKVVKNRLLIKSLAQTEKLSKVDTSSLKGQLLYAFNSTDEVAAAQVIAKFAKTEPQLTFVGAIAPNGEFIDATDVSAIANLPSKIQLRALLLSTFAAPLSGLLNVMSGNVRGVLIVLNARAENLATKN